MACIISDDMSSSSTKLIQESKEILSFKMKHLPDFVLKKLKEELKETPEKKRKGLLELKKMLDAKYDPNELPVEDFKRLVMMLFIQILRDPMTQINGFKFIHDFQGTTLLHLRQCTSSNLYLFYHAAI
ncbi:alpha-tocopherol transfer protein-like, partial [Nephila pilipes]